MDNSRLAELIKKLADTMIEEQLGYWKFEYADHLLFVITDESHNRMRIISPIIAIDDVKADEWTAMMRANFDRALDARYCVNNDTLWSAYIHPLQELASQQFLDAIDQVVVLAANFGTSYSSSNLVFGGDE